MHLRSRWGAGCRAYVYCGFEALVEDKQGARGGRLQCCLMYQVLQQQSFDELHKAPTNLSIWFFR